MSFNIPAVFLPLASRKVVLALALALTIPAVGCESTGQTIGAAGGGGIGATAGYFAGREMGGSKGAAVGAAAGAVLGSLIGGELGRRLDERDRVLASDATARALEGPVGTNVPWQSETNPGVRGQSQVVSVSRDPSGADCKMINELAVIQGEEIKQPVQYCQGSDLKWMRTA